MKYYIFNPKANEYYAAEGEGLVANQCDAHQYTEEEMEKYNLREWLDGPNNITGNYTIEITGTSEESKQDIQSFGEFGKILSSINSLLEYKNEKYGNAALEPLGIFEGKCKVGQRLDDKLARVKNSKGDLKKNDVADLIGYLTLVCKEKGWENFDEFKD
tara:strand:- start:1498 stop:1974 length:477 start_codon:yes stop_codon:yes gene_type:complete